MIECNQRDGDPTWDALRAQVARISGMDGFPFDREAKRELVLALCHARDVAAATGVIDGIVELAASDTRCPSPGDLRRACRMTCEQSRPDPECRACGGDGWRIIERGWLSGADRCDCWAPRPAPRWERESLRPPPEGERSGPRDDMRSVADVAGGAR